MVCQILLRDQEQLVSTFYLLTILQEVWRTGVGEYWQVTRLGPLSLLTVTVSWCNQQWCKVIASERPPELKPVCPNHAFLRGCYCLHKNTQTLPMFAQHLSQHICKQKSTLKVLAVLHADKHICIALTWNIIWQCYIFWSITLVKAWTEW